MAQYAGLAWQSVREAHDEVASIEHAQQSVLTWKQSRRNRIKAINALERERDAWQRELERRTLDLLFLLGLLDDRDRPQCHGEQLRMAISAQVDKNS